MISSLTKLIFQSLWPPLQDTFSLMNIPSTPWGFCFVEKFYCGAEEGTVCLYQGRAGINCDPFKESGWCQRQPFAHVICDLGGGGCSSSLAGQIRLSILFAVIHTALQSPSLPGGQWHRLTARTWLMGRCAARQGWFPLSHWSLRTPAGLWKTTRLIRVLSS